MERQVGVYRARFFVPMRCFDTLEELNQHLADLCLQSIQTQVHPHLKDHTIAQVLAQERPQLYPCPSYDGYRTEQVAVNNCSLVPFEGCRYSVPCHLVGKRVALPIRTETLSVVVNHEVLAEHERCWFKQQTRYNPWHYLPALERKPGALRNGAPFLHWPLPKPIQQLQHHLMKQPKGDRAMVQILTLIAEHGEEVGIVAAELALECGMPTVEAVQNLLHRLNEPIVPELRGPDIPLHMPPKIELNRYNLLLSHSVQLAVQQTNADSGGSYATA